jgi:hypothetical protein
LIAVDLLLLPVLFHIPALELIANQRARAQPEQAADGGSCPAVADSAANDSAGGSAAQRANARALLARRQWSRAAQKPRQQRRRD